MVGRNVNLVGGSIKSVGRSREVAPPDHPVRKFSMIDKTQRKVKKTYLHRVERLR